MPLNQKNLLSSNDAFLNWASREEQQFEYSPGKIVGKYKIVEPIGSGAFGQVYSAESPNGKKVALKLLLSWRNNNRHLLRFRREIEKLAKVSHPNVARLIDANTEDDIPHLATEFIEGVSLEEKIESAQESFDQKIKWLLDICRGVEFLHKRMILHRDLKPSNVIIAESGDAIVMDFGIAIQLTDDPRLTITGEIAGTPKYMAPEQLDRESELGWETDVYGLGALMYFLLTGEPPFNHSSFLEVADSVRSETPISPAKLNKAIDRDLSTICLKCLNKIPSDRYTSVSELADDLVRWQMKMPIKARPVSLLIQSVYFMRRNPTALALAVLLGASLLVGAIASAVLWRHAEINHQESNKNALVAERANSELFSLVDSLSEIERKAREQHKDNPMRREMLKAIAETYDKIERQSSFNAQLTKRAAVAWLMLGRIERSYGMLEDSNNHIDRAIRKFQQLAERFPEKTEYAFDVYHCLISQGKIDKALNVSQAIADKEPENSYYVSAVSNAYWLKANQLIDKGLYEEALAASEAGEAISRRIVDSHAMKDPPAEFFLKKLAQHQFVQFRARLLSGQTEVAYQHLLDSLRDTQACSRVIQNEPELLGDEIKALLTLSSLHAIDDEFDEAEKWLGLADNVSSKYLNLFSEKPDAYFHRYAVLHQRYIVASFAGKPTELDEAKKRLNQFFDRWELLEPENQHFNQVYSNYLLDHVSESPLSTASIAEHLRNVTNQEVSLCHLRLALFESRFDDAIKIHEEQKSRFFKDFYRYYVDVAQSLKLGQKVNPRILAVPSPEIQLKTLAYSQGMLQHVFVTRNLEAEIHALNSQSLDY